VGAMLAIGVDVGGTKIAAGVVDSDGNILESGSVATPRGDGEATAQAIFAAVDGLRAKYEVSAIGVGAAGHVTWPDGCIRYAPNIAYRDFALGRMLRERTGLPCAVDNDAAVAALAEHRLGAGRGVNDFVLVTVGTGIGGGLVLGGRVYRGARGFAAEVGHMVVAGDGPECACGRRGCWEQLASGTSLDRLAREAVAAGRGAAILDAAGGDPTRVAGLAVFEAASAGDPVAVSLFAEVGGWLGLGLGNLANILEPALLIVGGGLVKTGDLLLEPARQALPPFAKANAEFGYFKPIPIVPAELGQEAGLVGAALLGLAEGMA